MFERINPYWGVCFEDDKGAGNGDPANTQDKDANPGGDSGGQQQAGDKQFTQADVDRIVGERAKRASEAAVTKVLEELGFAKQTDLKAAVDAYRKAEDEKKTEMEKLQAEMGKLQEKAAQVEPLQAELDYERIKNAVISAAAEAGFINPADAFALLDTDDIEIGDEGKVTGFEKPLKALVESKRLPMRDTTPGDGVGTPPRKPAPAKTTIKPTEPPAKEGSLINF